MKRFFSLKMKSDMKPYKFASNVSFVIWPQNRDLKFSYSQKVNSYLKFWT